MPEEAGIGHKKDMKNSLLLCGPVMIMVLIFTLSASFAEEIRFDATVNRNIISLGQSIQLSLQFRDSRSVPAPELPGIDGFQSRYIGPSTRMSIVNGRMSSSVTHVYRLVPLKTGTFKIGPFSFEHDGNMYTSNPLTIEVRDAAAGQGAPHQGMEGAGTALKERLFLTMEAAKPEVYINEMVPVTIKLYVSGISIRDIQYPEYSHEGFSSGDFGKPLQYQETKEGIVYDVVEFRTDIFGTRPGELALGPATLQANIVMKKQGRRRSSVFDDFFGHDPFDDFFGYSAEPVKLSSEKTVLTVMPLPQDKRPEDFSGAVGDFDFSLDVTPKQVRAGDPLTVKMSITGQGNFSTVTSPKLEQSKDFKVYEPQVKENENRKIYEQILIPLSDAVKEIPMASFSFFNPAKGRYETITRGGMPVTVKKPEKKEEIAIMEAPRAGGRAPVTEKLGRDIIYIKESPGTLRKKGGYLYRNTAFLLLQAVPLLLFGLAWKMQKRRERISTDIGYARRLSAPKKAKRGIREAERSLHKDRTQEFYNSVHKTLREYIGDRFHLPTGGITSDIVDDALKDKKIDETILAGLKGIFEGCDMARYAPAQLSRADMENTLKALKEVIDYLERHK